MTLFDLLTRFETNEDCRKHLISIRWPDGVKCPRCECARVSEVKGRNQWTCLGCRYRFSAVSGTVFENSKIALKKWFACILLMIVSKKSQSSLQVKRQLGVSQECCWHMCHRLREAMREGADEREKFEGVVQVDEYYAAGDARKMNRHRRPFGSRRQKQGSLLRFSRDQQPVFGMMHPESGMIRTTKMEAVNGAEVQKHVDNWCEPAKSELHSDESKIYKKPGKQFTSHQVVCHSREYCREDGMNTNAIESAWSLFARSVVGSFHRVSSKHLSLYLAEFDSRFNMRDAEPEAFFDVILRRAVGRKLPLRQLVGQQA